MIEVSLTACHNHITGFQLPERSLKIAICYYALIILQSTSSSKSKLHGLNNKKSNLKARQLVALVVVTPDFYGRNTQNSFEDKLWIALCTMYKGCIEFSSSMIQSACIRSCHCQVVGRHLIVDLYLHCST